MDIAQQLAIKYPELFSPLIFNYEEVRNSDRSRAKTEKKLKKLIEDLLNGDGNIIQMHLNGSDPEIISNQFDISQEKVDSILAKYNKKDITSIDIKNVIYASDIEELRQRHQELFSPLIQSCNSSLIQDEKERSKLFKLVKNLLNANLNYGEIIELHNEGFSLQDIGNYQGVSRERIRQIIKKYEGYYIVIGSKEWTFNQLEKLTLHQEESRQLPSNKELERHHPKLIKALKSNFLASDQYQSEYLSQAERLEIAKNIGYNQDFIGTKEWCLQELDKITDLQQEEKIFPSNEQLNRQHPDLASSIREHFTQTKEYGELNEQNRLEVVKNLGYDVTEEVKQHTTWSEERVIYEVQEIARQLGKPDLMPMQKEFAEIGRSDLRGVIQRFGGQS